MVLVWKTYLRPLLEYATVVWNPISLRTSLDIERVQRRFTRLVPSVQSLRYHDRLKKLGLESLARRRLIADLVMTYKILFQQTTLNPDDFFVRNPRLSRGHSQKLRKRKAVRIAERQFFGNRVINDWNSLPQEVVESTSVRVFREKLRAHLTVKDIT